MRGRKPKPTALSIAEGDPSKLGKQKLEQMGASHPRAETGLPSCSERLQGLAREAYEYWREQLEKMRLAEMPDSLTLERAAVHYALAAEADIRIREEGAVIREPVVSRETGEIVGYRQKRSEWVLVRAEADRIFRQFATEFGLTPGSRTRLTVDHSREEEQDLMKILSQPRPQPVQ